MKNKLLKVNAIVCPKCHNTVYSRHVRDYRMCSCGSVGIDGGFDYIKVSYKPEIKSDDIEHINIYIDATKQDLYNDWNIENNKYGLIFSDDYFNKEEMLFDWILEETLETYNLKFLIDIYTNSDRIEVLEQIFCEKIYENRNKKEIPD